jgi:ankyrin repeat protein
MRSTRTSSRQWRRCDATVSKFEIAVGVVVAGDIDKLASLLREDPSLVRVRSERPHHATLLHYVSANGVEGERQKTPKNIVAIAKLLLDAGAQVDATAGLYDGHATTLGLAATSIHPFTAGVLEPLIDLLVERGADVNGSTSIAKDFLQNDRPEGAVLIARHCARLDLETAAGVGDLDVVKRYFDGTEPVNQQQLDDGFIWACEYGRREVVDFLIDRGVNLRADENTGQTALHLAAHHGELEIVKLLIARGAPLEARTATAERSSAKRRGRPGISASMSITRRSSRREPTFGRRITQQAMSASMSCCGAG